MGRDYLDDLIDANRSNDPEFNDSWTEVEIEFILSELRKRAGLTQEQVAAKMGVVPRQIAAVERHPFSVSFGRLLKYMNAIGADIRIVSDAKRNLRTS